MRMKKLFILLLVPACVWVYLHREQIYFHDVIAKVFVDGVRHADVDAYINAANDVLLISPPPPPTMLLVRHGDAAPVIPGTLTCLHWVACLAEDHDGISTSEHDARIVMGPRVVTFVNDAGKTVRVELY
jgi:hypothetical protein